MLRRLYTGAAVRLAPRVRQRRPTTNMRVEVSRPKENSLPSPKAVGGRLFEVARTLVFKARLLDVGRRLYGRKDEVIRAMCDYLWNYHSKWIICGTDTFALHRRPKGMGVEAQAQLIMGASSPGSYIIASVSRGFN